MAEGVKALGQGGQRQAETELGWHRRTIRKGQHELESGWRGYDNFAARGRKPAEHHLPNLLDDLKAMAEAESQTDPTFKTTRLYIRLSAAEVRKQWKMLVEIVRSLVVAYVLARFVVLLGSSNG